jgi:3'-phosphoadenosine 5'-phosphosulfate sulfotransferase (PAPS reductase)/FAD synthetase
MKRFIAFSGGVESTAMCLLYGKGATAVFTDTGSEHTEMYKRIDKVEKVLTEIHKDDFKLIRIRASVTAKGEKVSTLTDYVSQMQFFPSGADRFCTSRFKIAPLDNFLKSEGECELLIGLNADETDREGNHGLVSHVNYRYPLQEDGFTRQDCVNILDKYGLKPDFPAYMRRGGCIFCPFKSKKEYAAMVHLAPEEIDLVRVLEEKAQDKRGKYYRIRNNMPSMREFIETEKNNLFGDLSPYYDASEEQYSCGVFCHR